MWTQYTVLRLLLLSVVAMATSTFQGTTRKRIYGTWVERLVLRRCETARCQYIIQDCANRSSQAVSRACELLDQEFVQNNACPWNVCEGSNQTPIQRCQSADAPCQFLSLPHRLCGFGQHCCGFPAGFTSSTTAAPTSTVAMATTSAGTTSTSEAPTTTTDNSTTATNTPASTSPLPSSTSASSSSTTINTPTTSAPLTTSTAAVTTTTPIATTTLFPQCRSSDTVNRTCLFGSDCSTDPNSNAIRLPQLLCPIPFQICCQFDN